MIISRQFSSTQLGTTRLKSCQFYFPLLHFPFVFFYSITLFYFTFIAVLATAMSALMPKIFPLCVYTCNVHRALTSSVYTVCTVQYRHRQNHCQDITTPLPYNVDAHAKIHGGLFELCVYINTVQWPRYTVVYSCTEVTLWPIRASHPSRGHHTPHTRHQKLNVELGCPD